MKKIVFFLAFCVLSFIQILHGQCSAVTVVAFPMSPQSGAYNFFGVRVTLNQAYNQDVTVTGYIHRDADEWNNQDNPFTLTVPAGSLTAETSASFYGTGPTDGAAVTVSSISPCPENDLTPEALAADNDFIQLIQLTGSSFGGFDSVIINTPEEGYENYSEQIQFYTSQSQLNNAQVTNFSNLMGFPSASAFADYVNTTTALISRIRNRYSAFQTGNINELKDIVISAFYILNPGVNSDLCEQIYRNCKAGAHAVYSTEIIACTGAAIGVGSATFGLGGIIFQMGCGAAAIWHYKTMRRNCELEYRRCR